MLRDDAIRAGKIKPNAEDRKRMGLKEPKPEKKPKKKSTGRHRRIRPDSN